MLLNTKRIQLAIITLLQVILIAIAFKGYFKDPKHFTAQNMYDGQHINFTYISHVMQPKDVSIWKLNQQFYPYGDYVTFSDNPLILTIPLKFISNNIVDLKPLQFALFNGFNIFSVLLSALLVCVIMRRFTSNWLVIVASAIGLPWLCPMTLRLTIGHFNLAHSFLLLAAIYLLVRRSEAVGTNWKYLLAFTVLIFIGTFFHIYFLALLSLLILPTLFVLDILQADKKSIKDFVLYKKHTLIGVASVGVAAGLAIALINGIDSYAALRGKGASGYDWAPWKLNFTYIFSSYPFIKNPFFFKLIDTTRYESYAYLGGFALMVLSGLFIYKLFNKTHAKEILQQATASHKHFWIAILVTGLVSFFISLGEYIYVANDEYVFKNYLNILFYLRKITEQVTQFRCLGRFVWVWWWPLSLFVMVLVAKILEQPKTWMKYVVAGFALFYVSDIRDFISFYKKEAHTDQILSKEKNEQWAKSTAGIDFNAYQAILPLPFYIVCSADMNYTIDGNADWCVDCNSLTHFSKLPLISTQNARLPEIFVKGIFSIFIKDTVAPALISKLNDKKILVVVKKSLFEKNGVTKREVFNGIERRPGYDAFFYGKNIIEKYGMQLIKEDEQYAYYSWDAKRNNIRVATAAKFSEANIAHMQSELSKNESWRNGLQERAMNMGVSVDSLMRVEVLKELDMAW
jgi:hypothetical protein